MKRNMIAKCLLLVLVALMAILGRADMPRPSYSCHAMSYPTWLLDKLTHGHGRFAMLAIIVLVPIALAYICFYVRRTKKLRAHPTCRGGTLPSDGNGDGKPPLTDFDVLELVARIFNVIFIVASVLTAAWLFFGEQINKILLYCGHYDITVDSMPGESYKEYLKRVYHLCPKCDSPMHKIYDAGRRWVCDKCDGDSCSVCGKKIYSHMGLCQECDRRRGNLSEMLETGE